MNALRTACRHPVTAVLFSPDGSQFATAQPQHGITLHDRMTGQPVRTFGNPLAAEYFSCLFCDDGRWLAAATPKGLELFDVATGAAVWKSYAWPLGHVRLAADRDRLLAVGGKAVIEVPLSFETPLPKWRLVWPGEEHFSVEDLRPSIDRAVARNGKGVYPHLLSPNGRWLLGLRRNDSPVVVDVAARKVVAVLDHPATVGEAPLGSPMPRLTVAFVAAADRLAVGDGRTVDVFDVGEGSDKPGESELSAGSLFQREQAPLPRSVLRPLFQLDRPEGETPGQWWPPIALTPDGRGLLVRRPRQRVQLWDVRTGRLADEWGWRLEAVTCLGVAPDGLTAVAGGRFGRIVTWDLE